ncbi:MAG: YidC/Oxa1 family membrane protein insertase [Patescibacteria group bacterium]
MISSLFRQIFFNPLYNLLITLSVFLPGHSFGGAIIVLTLLVKIILLPLQHKTLKIQKKLKILEPQLTAVKKLHQHDRNEQARKIMELYRTHGVNPLTTFWTILVQIPIVLALFMAFRSGATLHSEFLYSFTPSPESISLIWFGLIDLTKSFFPLSLLVGISQFIQLQLSMPAKNQSITPNKTNSPQDFARNLQSQMRYTLPVFVVFAASTLPAAISLYWLTSNLFTIGHELVVRRETKELIHQSNKDDSSIGQ